MKILLPLATLGLLLAACSPSTVSARRPPLIVVGADGLEWDVILPLVREGRMPALTRLMARGVFGELETQAPAKSPVIWTTVATGKEPAKHGVLDFTRRGPDGSRVLYTSADRTTKALWNVLDDFGQRCAVLGWWTTFPVEAIDGVMVSQPNRGLLKPGGIEPGREGQVHPPELEDEVFAVVDAVDRELDAHIEDTYPGTVFGDAPADRANWEACRWTLRADESIRRVALDQIASPLVDVLMVYFSSPDVIGHRFWRFHDPTAFTHPPSKGRIAEVGDVLNCTYARFDGALGELIDALPSDATIVVMSDHGMQPKRVEARFDPDATTQLERESGGHGSGPPGVLIAAGPGLRRVSGEIRIDELTRADLPVLGDVVDITPTLLALRNLPIGHDMDGDVLTELFTLKFAEGLDLEYVDSHDTPEWRAGRDPTPRVAPPAVEERLQQLRSLGYLSGDE